MQTSTSPPLIIYHSHTNSFCPDGIWAAWVAKLKWPNATLLKGIHGQPITIDQLKDHSHIICVDFSLSFDLIKELRTSFPAIEITIIDHHKTTLNDLAQFSLAVLADDNDLNINLDTAESGATLTWKTLFSEDLAMPFVLNYVADHDLWLHKLESSREIYAAMSLLNLTDTNFELFDMLAGLDQAALLKTLLPIGEQQNNFITSKAASIVESRITHTEIGNHPNIPTVVLNSEFERSISDQICEYMYTSFCSDAKFVCTTSFSEDNLLQKYSLRSNSKGSDFDVSEVAKLYGGGGHKNAAGFAIKLYCTSLK